MIQIRIEGTKGKNGKNAVNYACTGISDYQDLIIEKISDDVYYIIIKDLKRKKKHTPIGVK